MSALLLRCAKNLLEQIRAAGDGVFTDGFFLFGDFEEQPIQRLVSDAGIKVDGIATEKGANQASFVRHLLIGAGHTGFRGGLFHNGVEARIEIGLASRSNLEQPSPNRRADGKKAGSFHSRPGLRGCKGWRYVTCPRRPQLESRQCGNRRRSWPLRI